MNMSNLEHIKSLEAILTADCNLSCEYCYQNAKKPLRMSWETLRTSLNLILNSGHSAVNILFLGGEPLLEFPLIRQAVSYVEKNRPSNKRVIYHISTNGTLLTKERLAFLKLHRFKTQISFDGVTAAQNVRGPGTFAILDHLLDHLRQDHAEFMRKDITISLTMTPDTIIHLAASVEYFLKKRVRNISIGPIINALNWEPNRIDELDDLFSRVFESSWRHWQETGKIPMLLFRYSLEHTPLSPNEQPTCGLIRNEIMAVDVDGHAYGCAVLAGSYQEYGDRGLLKSWPETAMGSIHDPAFAKRHAVFPEAALQTGMFDRKQDKYSAYGQCRECRYFARCFICPCSTGHMLGNLDPNRVSDFCCAWSMVALKYRDRFLAQRRKRDFRLAPKGVAASMERWQALVDAMTD